MKDKTTGTVRAKYSRFCGFLFVDRADWKMVFLEKFVAEVQIYRKTIIIGCLMEMFSKELIQLDRNTVQYMIDEMQDTIDVQKEKIDTQKEELEAKQETIDSQKATIDTQKEELEAARRRLREMAEKLEQLEQNQE